jgi:Protein of unknown function (DUF2892)
MKTLFSFLASTAGRIVRIVIGIALIVVGAIFAQGTLGTVITIIGVVPLAAGVFDVCLLAPLVGLPFQGERIREPQGRPL